MGLEAVERLHPVGPLVVRVSAVAADEFVAGAARVGRAHLEAGGEDEAIDLVRLAVRDDTALRDPLDPLAVGVDQRDVGPRLNVAGTRRGNRAACRTAGTTASVPRPSPDRVTISSTRARICSIFGEVGQLDPCAILRSPSVPARAAMPDAEIADDVGPAVVDQIFLLPAAGDEYVEVLIRR